MTKKYLFLVTFASAFLLAGSCYAMEAVKVESMKVEGSVSASTSTSTKSSETEGVTENKTQVQESGRLDAAQTQLNTKIDSNAETDSQRLLPTVNKRTAEAKVTVRGWDPDKKGAIATKIKTETENNPQINSVDISEEAVVMDYSAPAKLLGFIPWNMRINVSADVNARVKVKFPWYKFMMKSDFDNASEVMNGVFQNNQTDLEFLKSKNSDERQIEIFLKISNMMHNMSKSIIQNIKA